MFFSRGKNKNKSDYSMGDIYKYYRKSIEKGSIYDIPKAEYIKICAEFNESLIDRLLERGISVKFPGRFGRLKVVKFKTDYSKKYKIPVDWKKTAELGKKIYILNEHTDGFIYKIKWERNSVFNQSFYNFIPTRTKNRRLAEKITNKEMEYA